MQTSIISKSEPSWPRNAWYLAAWDSDILSMPLARTILDQPIVIYRDQQGKVAALEDRCCHRAAPLSMGRIVANGLQCGYHGLIFDTDGRCISVPGETNIPPQARVKSFPVVLRGEFVWVWLGDPSAADQTQIPPLPPYDDGTRGSQMHGMFSVKCNYMLLVDNLMDLTHIPFVHASTIGGAGSGQMEVIKADVKTTRTDRGVHYVRWILGHTPPPIYVKGLGLQDGVKVDRWQDFEYVAPGIVLQWTGGMEEGRGARENREQSGALSVRLFHGITPETEDSCLYFWMRADSAGADATATAAYYKEFEAIIAEDVAILEAQNRRLAANPRGALVDFKGDSIRTMARRATDRMIRREIEQTAVAS